MSKFILCGILVAAFSRASLAQSQPELVPQVGNRMMITSMALSPDRRTLATGGMDGSIVIWDAQTGDVERTLIGSAGQIFDLVFSPDGKTLLSGSGIAETHDDPDGPGEARFWDLSTGKTKRVLPPFPHPVSHVAFTQGGTQSLTVCYRTMPVTATQPAVSYREGPFNTRIQRWNTDTLAVEGAIELPNTHILDLKVSPDGRNLAMGIGLPTPPPKAKRPMISHWSTELRLYDPATLQLRRRMTVPEMQLQCLAWSPDGKCIATGHDTERSQEDPKKETSGRIRIWDAASGKLNATLQSGLKSDYSGVTAIAWSADGAALAAAKSTMGDYVQVWDLSTHQLRQRLGSAGSDQSIEHPERFMEMEQLTGVAFTSVVGHSRLVATGGYLEHGSVQLWDVSKSLIEREVRSALVIASGLQISPDGTNFAVNFNQPSMQGKGIAGLKIWSLRTGELQKSIATGGDSFELSSLAYMPDGAALALDSEDPLSSTPNLRFFSTTSGKLVGAGARHRSLLASGKANNTTGDEDESGVGMMALSPDGHTMARSNGQRPRLYAVNSSGGKISVKPGLELPVEFSCGDDLAFSPDGKSLAAVGGRFDINYGETRVWSVPSGRPVWAKTSDKNYAATVAFSPDSSLLATGQIDGKIRIWDARTGQVTHVIPAAVGLPIRALVFGDTLWSASGDGILRGWDVMTGQETAHLEIGAPITSLSITPDKRKLLVLSPQGIIAVWRLIPKPELALTLTILGVTQTASGPSTQWVAVTPNGHYISSPGAAKSIRWLKNGTLLPISPEKNSLNDSVAVAAELAR